MTDGIEAVTARLLEATSEIPRLEKTTGADVLNDVREYIARFCAFPSEHALNAVTLWAAHTHMAEYLYTSPRLAVLSPEPESGKTRVLDVLDLLVSVSMKSVNASPAAIFRTLNKKMVTLLLDEVDAIWSKKGKDDNHEDLRALLNAGYKRGATIPRCVGAQHDVVDFPVFCPVALAGIGSLPETILTRSIVIPMRRRAPHEMVESFREREQETPGKELRGRLALWAESVGSDVGAAWPDLPDGIADRRAEVWEPMIAVADAAGGDWPVISRAACTSICATTDSKVSLGVRLLSDLVRVFGDAIALHTATILERLTEGKDHEGEDLDADAPWKDLYARGLSSRDLAKLLGLYKIRSTKVNVNSVSLQGYRREDLHEEWLRYLPSYSAQAELPEPKEQFAAKVLEVPHIPLMQGTKGDAVCPKCDGEGCGWCETSNKEATQ